MDGIQTMNHVAKKWHQWMGCPLCNVAKSGYLWMGCPLCKQ